MTFVVRCVGVYFIVAGAAIAFFADRDTELCGVRFRVAGALSSLFGLGLVIVTLLA